MSTWCCGVVEVDRLRLGMNDVTRTMPRVLMGSTLAWMEPRLFVARLGGAPPPVAAGPPCVCSATTCSMLHMVVVGERGCQKQTGA